MTNHTEQTAALPEPAFMLRWHPDGARYTVSKPNIGDTECYTVDQVRQQFNAGREFEAERLSALTLPAAASSSTEPVAGALVGYMNPSAHSHGRNWVASERNHFYNTPVYWGAAEVVPPASWAPAGFKLVPIEPTDEMEIAAENDYEQAHSHFPDWKRAYRAMVAAASNAEEPAGGDAQSAALVAREACFDVPVGLSDAARDVLAERRRQVSAEGWTPEHDDEHDKGELAVAAALYALRRKADPVLWVTSGSHPGGSARFLESIEGWVKPCSYRRGLVKSAALSIAEIERMDRAALAASSAPPASQDAADAQKGSAS